MLKSVNRLVAVVLLAIVSPANMRAQPSNELVRFDAASYIRSQFQQHRAAERGGRLHSRLLRPSKLIYRSRKGQVRFRRSFTCMAAVDCMMPRVNASRRSQWLGICFPEPWIALRPEVLRRIVTIRCRIEKRIQRELWYTYQNSISSINDVLPLGSSEGGIVTLRLAAAQDAKVFDVPNDVGFPPQSPSILFAAPPRSGWQSLLVLIGEKDDWTPAKKLRSGRWWSSQRERRICQVGHLSGRVSRFRLSRAKGWS